MMRIPRVIPILLLSEGRLVKTRKFSDQRYVGDPINAIKLFNDKEVDEIAVLDINACFRTTPPDYKLIERLAGECFMPLSYGGGVRTVSEAKTLVGLGVEKVIINTAAHRDPTLIQKASQEIGSQSIVASVDVKRSFFGRSHVWSESGTVNTKQSPVECARRLASFGAGEILLTCVDSEGEMKGYNLTLISEVARSVDVPVLVNGGAGNVQHMREALGAGASAVAAGSMFVFHGRHRAVLISYLNQDDASVLVR